MPPVASPSLPVRPIPPMVPRADIYHLVGPGETLWRIGKMYDVPVASIMQANNVSDPQNVSMGQRLFVPRAAKIRPVVALFPSEKWKYIIIHHSGTEEGNSLEFHRAHLGKGWDRGVGYHFIVDNGTQDRQDGQIEVGPRWIKQEDGAHCKADGMNERAIGICLVGNFSGNDKVSERQMESLVFLVSELKRFYKIPSDHIKGHRHVDGASTECPGNLFPWDKFHAQLRKAEQSPSNPSVVHQK